MTGMMFTREAHCAPQDTMRFEGTELELRSLMAELGDKLECGCCGPTFRGDMGERLDWPFDFILPLAQDEGTSAGAGSVQISGGTS